MLYSAIVRMKKISLLSLLGLIVVLLAAIVIKTNQAKYSMTPMTNSASKQVSSPAVSSQDFDRHAYSTTETASPWVIVNKQHQLIPKAYVPANLTIPTIPLRSNITSDEKYVRSDTATALEQMVTAARAQGINLNLQSGYRSYAFQNNLYDSYVKTQGQSVADTQSARPGYSEHQTGLAADLGGTSDPSCNLEQCFDGTEEGKWLASNAYKYGFIIRYPKDKQAITGYEYEPWHVRFVGIGLSTEMHNKDITTLEEFFSVTGGTSYR